MTPEQIAEIAEKLHYGIRPNDSQCYALLNYITALDVRVKAAEKRVKAARGALADIFDGEPQWPDKPKKELLWCRKRAEEAYRATGGQDNE